MDEILLFFLVLIAIVFILLIFTVMGTLKIVHTGEVAIIERFGVFHKILSPGVNFVLPFADYVRQRVSTKQQILDIPPQSVITKDNVRVTVDNVVFYRVMDPRSAVYDIEHYLSGISYSTITNMRNVLGNLTLDEILSGRDKINSELLTIIDQVTDAYGVKVLSVEIKNIIVNEEIQAAMEKEMRAERERRATILEAEGFRKSLEERAEGEKRSKILQAEASKEAQLLEAQGKAQAIGQVAAAESKAIELIKDALNKEHNDNAAYLALKQVEALKELATQPSNKLILPNEAISSLGSLAAAVEILKGQK